MKNDNTTDIGSQVILAEANALINLSRHIDQDFQSAVDMILASQGHVIFTGIGKSGHIGKKLAATFASTGTPSFFVHAAEAVHGDLGMFTGEDIVIAISHSGSTDEVVRIIPIIKQIGARIISITSNKDSVIAKESSIALITGVENEADPRGQAPTSSAIATLALGDALAIAISERRGFTRKDFKYLHPGGALGREKIAVS